MDVDDPHAFALELLGRRDEQADIERASDQRGARPAQKGGQGSRDFEETGRIRVDVHCWAPV